VKNKFDVNRAFLLVDRSFPLGLIQVVEHAFLLDSLQKGPGIVGHVGVADFDRPTLAYGGFTRDIEAPDSQLAKRIAVARLLLKTNIDGSRIGVIHPHHTYIGLHIAVILEAVFERQAGFFGEIEVGEIARFEAHDVG